MVLNLMVSIHFMSLYMHSLLVYTSGILHSPKPNVNDTNRWSILCTGKVFPRKIPLHTWCTWKQHVWLSKCLCYLYPCQLNFPAQRKGVLGALIVNNYGILQLDWRWPGWYTGWVRSLCISVLVYTVCRPIRNKKSKSTAKPKEQHV